MTDSGKIQLLQQLQQAIPDASREELAALLQLEIRPATATKANKKPADDPALPIGGAIDIDKTRPDSSPDYPPENKEVPFLYLHGYEQKEEAEEASDMPDTYRNATLFKKTIPSSPGSEIDPEPLTPWQEIWPVLHTIFARQTTTKRLDIEKIIRKKIKQQPITAIPWQEKKQWPGEIVLLADFSPHLSPYFKDYLAVVEQMTAWFGDRIQIVVCVDSEEQHFIYQNRFHEEFPIREENLSILYLGDLGFLDKQGISSACYYYLGEELHRLHAHIEALLTVAPSDYDRSLGRFFHFHHWDRTIAAPVTGASGSREARFSISRQQVNELLTALSPAFELTPALVRKMRHQLGLNVSVESLVLQDEALKGNGLSYQWQSEKSRQQWQDRLAALAESHPRAGTMPQLWKIIEKFETRLPLELQIEQRQKAGQSLNETQQSFLHSLVRSIYQNTLEQDNDELVFAWLDRLVRKRAGDEQWYDEFEILFYCYWSKKKPRNIPKNIDLTSIPRWITAPEREYWLETVIIENRICFSGKDLSFAQSLPMTIPSFQANSHSQVTLFSRDFTKGQKYTLPLDGNLELPDGLQECRIETSRESYFLKTMSCPAWASAIGRDQYGLFAEVTVNKVCFVMRWLPPGTFMMGSPEDEPERYSDEGPQHEVHFKEGFWLAETACTQELWYAIMKKNPSKFDNDTQNPVENVTREMVLHFRDQLNSRLPGLNMRLPSEAEWEYGCRAGTTTPFWFGEALDTDKANYNGEYPYNNGANGIKRGKTMPVKSFHANPWGLYQMHGNVWELCMDFWHDDYTPDSTTDDPAPTDGSAWQGGDTDKPVSRGGSWLLNGRYLRSASRRHWLSFARDHLGFRLARGPEGQAR